MPLFLRFRFLSVVSPRPRFDMVEGVARERRVYVSKVVRSVCIREDPPFKDGGTLIKLSVSYVRSRWVTGRVSVPAEEMIMKLQWVVRLSNTYDQCYRSRWGVGEAHVLEAEFGIVSVEVGWVHQFWVLRWSKVRQEIDDVISARTSIDNTNS